MKRLKLYKGFTKPELKEIASQCSHPSFESYKRNVKSVMKSLQEKPMDDDKSLVMNGVKLLIAVHPGVCIVKIAYLAKEKRGQGLYKKSMDQLLEKYGEVLYEPTYEWTAARLNQPHHDISMVHYSSGPARTYFRWGTEKEPLGIPPYEDFDMKGVDFEDIMKMTLTALMIGRGTAVDGVEANCNVAAAHRVWLQANYLTTRI